MSRDLSMSVRACLAAIAGFCALLASMGLSQAQTKYPEKPVRIIVPYGAGGVADVTTRLVAQKVSEAMGQTFVIENRPGAGGIVGAKAVLASPPDGYTPVAPLAEFEMLLATKADSSLDTVAKVVAYAKANPGKLNFGTIATGSTQHLSAELFKLATGVQAPIVIYKTTPELVTAILRGDVYVGFDYYAAFGPSIVNKQFKVIATSGEQRSPQLPAVPTVKESGYPDFVVTSWNAIQGPAGVPKDIVTKLNEHIVAALKTPEIQARMGDLGIHPMIGSPEFLDERMKSEIAKWAKVIQAAGVEKQ